MLASTLQYSSWTWMIGSSLSESYLSISWHLQDQIVLGSCSDFSRTYEIASMNHRFSSTPPFSPVFSHIHLQHVIYLASTYSLLIIKQPANNASKLFVILTSWWSILCYKCIAKKLNSHSARRKWLILAWRLAQAKSLEWYTLYICSYCSWDDYWYYFKECTGN